jgi:hypothetical protein
MLCRLDFATGKPALGLENNGPKLVTRQSFLQHVCSFASLQVDNPNRRRNQNGEADGDYC